MDKNQYINKKKQARIAGSWYLCMAITGAFGILYGPSFLLPGDSNITARDIIDSENIF